MPIYEYRCAQCSEQFEELVGAAWDGKIKCPACSSAQVERLLSTFAVSGAKTDDAEPSACCGLTSPCDDPKRCCER